MNWSRARAGIVETGEIVETGGTVATAAANAGISGATGVLEDQVEIEGQVEIVDRVETVVETVAGWATARLRCNRLPRRSFLPWWFLRWPRRSYLH
jgi:hypothetical protein